jgi:MFS family permease
LTNKFVKGILDNQRREPGQRAQTRPNDTAIQQGEAMQQTSISGTGSYGGLGEETFVQADRIYPGWLTVIAGALALTFGPSTMTIMSFGSFVPALDKEFGWGIPAISLGATILTYMIMITSVLQGYLVDRYGARPLIVLSIPIFAVSLASVSLLNNNIILFYLAWLAVPLCGLGAWPISYLKATSGWFERRLGLALGLTNAGIGVGAAILPVIIAFVITNYGWRSAYLCLGLFAIVVTWPVTLLYLRENTAAGAAGKGSSDSASEKEFDLRSAARTSTFRISLVAFAILGVLNVGMLVHLVKICIDEGLTPQAAGFIMSSLGIALIVGRVATGWLLDRFAASSVMLVITLGTAAACAALAAGAGSNVAAATACASMIGLVIGAEFDALSYMIPRYWGRKAFGKIYGAVFAVFQFAAGFGAAGLGFSRGHFGSYAPALWVLAALMVICAVLFSQLGPYRFGHRDPMRAVAEPAVA